MSESLSGSELPGGLKPQQTFKQLLFNFLWYKLDQVIRSNFGQFSHVLDGYIKNENNLTAVSI